MFSLKCIFIVFSLIKTGESCDFNFKTSYPKNPPLIFNNADRNLIIPIKKGSFRGVHFNVGDEILLSCAGRSNRFQDISVNDSKPSIVLTCTGKDLTDGTNIFNFRNLGCQTRTRSMILKLWKPCANGKAELFEIGYNITLNSGGFWYPLINVCFNASESRTYFSNHKLSGKGISASQSFRKKPYFEVGLMDELYPDFSPNRAYKNQSNTLARLLGSDFLAQQILSNKSFISRGHLAPNADFFYDITRASTYYYVNTAPQWNAVNGGAWNNLENHIRRLARKRGRDYNIYTGTHEILTFLNKNSKQAQIYLFLGENGESNKLPVPRFIWKIVQELDENGNILQGVAFVSYNNNTASSESVRWPCGNICNDYNWYISSRKSTELVMICCEVKDLKRAIPDIPEMRFSGGILQGF